VSIQEKAPGYSQNIEISLEMYQGLKDQLNRGEYVVLRPEEGDLNEILAVIIAHDLIS
jgi:hypothetical protein